MIRLLAAGALFVASPAISQNPAPPARAPDYGIAVPVPGSWRLAPIAGGSSAIFSSTQGQPLLTLTCNRALRRVSISRPATGAAPYLYVWATAMNRSIPASFNPATRLITAELSAYDKLLDALAFSRGRIVVGPSTGGTLVAPMWPEIARVVEDCRT